MKAPSIIPRALRCEFVDTPLAVHAQQPLLSWQVAPLDLSARGLHQSMYEIVVASDPERLTPLAANLWYSGHIASNATSVAYAGHLLRSFQSCFWKVRVRDQDEQASDWSFAARFEMGLLEPGDWMARWIGSPDTSCVAPLFRKTFQIPHSPALARAYICGLGYYELYLNGQRVGDHVLDPAQTDYESRAFYVAYDVTAMLREGENAAAVVLGNGFFNQDRVWGGMSYGRPRFILQLRTQQKDGTVSTPLRSDDTWLTTGSAITENNVYAGETCDARREISNFAEPGCDERGWTHAVIVESPTRSLEPQMIPPIRETRRISPIAISRLGPLQQIVDFGQNFAGHVRLTTNAPRGAAIRIRTAESLHPDGTLDTASTGVFATGVEQVDTYISRGGEETWEPRFTYHGFRYAEISGVRDDLPVDSVKGVAVHSDVEPVGTFECSDPVLNRMHRAASWTLLSNLHSVPTDCPAREKCGWLGDAHVAAEMSLYNFDTSALLAKYVRDIETSWRGNLPGDVAPGKRCSNPSEHVDWGLAIVFLPWLIHCFRGDDRILREHYASMKRFMTAAAALCRDGIFKHGYGDWCPPGSVEPTLTPPALTTTALFTHAARLMASVADTVAKFTDSSDFGRVAQETAAAFHRTFFDPTRNSYGSQCADAMALELDLTPEDLRQAVADSLAHDVMVTHNAHSTTGIFGSKYLFPALARHGHGDAALAVLRQTTYPSIGHLFSLGATTFWECWGEPELDRKWGARSRNHPMQAAFTSWFYSGLGGIAPSSPGFRHVLLHPQIISDAQLTWVRATHRSPHGPISAFWQRRDDGLDWQIELPPNTSGTVLVPVSGNERVLESGRPVEHSTEVRETGSSGHYRSFEIGSGRYCFEIRRA